MAVVDGGAGGAVVLYRYGALAWFWRVLMAFGAALGAGAGFLAWSGAGWLLWLAAAALLMPVVFFGCVVATLVTKRGDVLHVSTLLGMPRRIGLAALGRRKVSHHASTDSGQVYAPRLWQFVRGALPLYLDLLATIPDRGAFERVFGPLRANR